MLIVFYYFIYSFDNGVVQIVVVFVIELAFTFRGYFLKKLSRKNVEIEENTHASGAGYIKDMVVLEQNYIISLLIYSI